MLAWKWWRDCRGRVLLYFGAALAFGSLASIEAGSFSRWVDQYRYDPVRANFYLFLMWDRVRHSLLNPMWYGAMWIGLALAISSFGKDYASPAVTFLITRPRSRIAMLWTDWALAQMAAVLAAVALLGSASAVAARWLPYVRASALWAIFPAGIVVAVAVYGVTLFWTAVTRSAVRGVELTIATMLTVWLAPGALREWWHIAWPEQFQIWMFRIFNWYPTQVYWTARIWGFNRPGFGAKRYVGTDKPFLYHSLEPYPLAVLVTWIAIGLALTYATQKIMERREV